MLPSKSIEIVPYSAQWPAAFQQLKAIYEATLQDLVEGIEHVGSTSVPGLQAKPIIDINLIVADAANLSAVISKLEALGYHHVGDQGIAGREVFKRAGPHVPLDGSGRAWPAHHLYVCQRGALSLLNHLQFRDFLRSNPEQARAYGQLKEELAARASGDMNRYLEGKTSFILRVLDQFGFEAGQLGSIRTPNELPADAAIS